MQTFSQLVLAIGVEVVVELIAYYLISGEPLPIGLRLRLGLLHGSRMGAIRGSRAADSAPRWLESK